MGVISSIDAKAKAEKKKSMMDFRFDEHTSKKDYNGHLFMKDQRIAKDNMRIAKNLGQIMNGTDFHSKSRKHLMPRPVDQSRLIIDYSEGLYGLSNQTSSITIGVSSVESEKQSRRSLDHSPIRR